VDCDIAQNLFSQVKEIVSNMRRKHQQQNLSRKLQTYSETRFNGAFITLNIFKELYLELPSVLINSKYIENYNLVEKDLLDEICELLVPYQEVIDALSEDQRLSIHRVIPLRQCLIRKCSIDSDDSIGIVQLKRFLGKIKSRKVFSIYS